jgi:hypothetical protein
MSGQSMDDVKVHYNSNKPAQLQAHAYAQGSDIHIASGQEKHLPHEAWHVVQQKQGRVDPTMQLKGKVNINDDTGLEKEADLMGAKAIGIKQDAMEQEATGAEKNSGTGSGHLHIVQRVTITGLNHNHDMNRERLTELLADRAKAWSKDNKLKWERVEPHFNQYGSNLAVFENEEHFFRALLYDAQTKSIGKEPLTAQEEWTTRRGWRERALNKTGAKASDRDIVKLYRTMDQTEYDAIKAGKPDKLGGHIGDFKEALRYLYGESADPKCMVEFDLTVAGIKNLFSHAAFPPALANTLVHIDSALRSEKPSFAPRQGASQDQGYAKDSVGLKSEDLGDAGMSFGIGAGAKPAEIFMKLVIEHRLLATKIKGKPVVWVSGSGSSSGSGREAPPPNPAAAALAGEITADLALATPIEADPRAVDADEADLVAMHNEPLASGKVKKKEEGEKKAAKKEESGKKAAKKEESGKKVVKKGKDKEKDKDPRAYAARANWTITDHGAGGDCLFFSLNASNDQAAADALRVDIATSQSENDSIGQGVVDHDLRTMLEQSPHAELNAIAENVAGLENIPVAAYHRLMAFQGTWAGRSEVNTFSTIRGVRVFVIEEQTGLVTRYAGGVGTNIPELPGNAFGGGNIVLYKSNNHWQRVDGVA